MNNNINIQLSHGGGGEEMSDLIESVIFRHFGNSILNKAEDAALLRLSGNVAFTTDSFTVSPLFFEGGDIGRLAIAGSINDLAMMGAEPLYLSCSFIIEEGLDFGTFGQIVQSMAAELATTNAQIVCGDTKVVPKGCADKLFINTSAIGLAETPGLSSKNLQIDDVIIVSGDIGRHGAAILVAREGLTLNSELVSDCKVLWPTVQSLLSEGIDIHAMRDATRGGLAAVLNEWAVSSGVSVLVDEHAVPVSDEVAGLCELYGFEAYDLANEGTFVLALPAHAAEDALNLLKATAGHADAAIIGKVTSDEAGRVKLRSSWGTTRYLELPKGELLPRIC